MYRESDSRPPVTPQLALRVAIIGGVALVIFGIIFFRLWYLQILSGDRYRAEANNNRVREITVPAPRGKIVDRNGRVLVDNRSGYAVEVDPSKLPHDNAGRSLLFARLGAVLGMRPASIGKDVDAQFKKLPFSQAIVKEDVPPPVYQYILEHQQSFPSVTVEQIFLRSYPHHDVGAHLFGYVSQVTQEELKSKGFAGVRQGDRVGQTGIESTYDRYLRGLNGANRVQVDALGTLRGRLSTRAPRIGRQLRLTLDYDAEQTGQQALAGQKGAFVAMDVKTGEVRALGSSPSFDPNIFSKTIKESDFKRLNDPNQGEPLANRAIQGAYPTGSTFKLISSVASLENGLITPDTVKDDPGSFTVGRVTFVNAGHAVNGALALRRALQVSSDVFFYQLGAELNGHGDGLGLQHWAFQLGLGHPTGIDLPAENAGLVPSPEWRNRLYRQQYHANPGCIQAGLCRPWSTGDNVNLSVGQGDLQADPLQMAVAYSAVANGGWIVRPHLGARLEDSLGRALQELGSPPRRRMRIDAGNRQAILEGLNQAAEQQGGTSYPVFKDFPIKIAGKTGTAQHGAGRADQSWYVALAPYPDPQYVVAVTFETGGFGVETAAPAAKKILASLFHIHLSAGQAANSPPPAGVNAFG
ncbi:MAG: penicillin-binding protein 2 [Thermoleophilaceae bacterium]